MIIYKPAAVGSSWIPGLHTPFQARHVLHELPILPVELFRQGYLAVLVCQITRVEDFETALGQVEEPDNIHIFDQRLANVIHLPSVVISVGIRKKSNSFKKTEARRDINKLALWTAPNGMELCLDEYTGTLPDAPPKHALPARLQDLLFNNGEALALKLAHEWLTANGDRMIALDKAAAKLSDMHGADICGVDHVSSYLNSGR